MLAAGIAAIAIAASIAGLWNGFTYDDRHIVLANPFIKDIHRIWTLFVLPYWPIAMGGDGYRPMTLTAFAIQWAIRPGSPTLFHAVNIALYVAVCLAAYRFARQLLPPAAAWLTTALFAAHPVHVESVANVVGQSELWVALCLILATSTYVAGRRSGTLTQREQAGIAGLYLAACLFKEHGIVLPAILIGAELLLVPRTERFLERTRPVRGLFLLMLLTAGLYVYFRTAVIGRDIAGFSVYPPFYTLHVGYGERVLTMLGVVPHWVRLLLWPARLSAEYGPPGYPIATGLALWQLPGLLILAGVMGGAVALRRREPVVSFGILWMAVTLLPSSNFIVPSGILLAERTLFSPSLGALIAIGALLPRLVPHLRTSLTRVAVIVCFGVLLGAGMAKSLVQSTVWRNNESLFVASVAAEPNVYRGYYMLAALLMDHNQYVNGEKAYFKAISLFERDPFVFYNLGQEYFRARQYDAAYEMYLRSYQIVPGFQDVRTRLAFALAAAGRFPEARARAQEALRHGATQIRPLHTIIAAADIDARGRAARLAAAAPTRVIAR